MHDIICATFAARLKHLGMFKDFLLPARAIALGYPCPDNGENMCSQLLIHDVHRGDLPYDSLYHSHVTLGYASQYGYILTAEPFINDVVMDH